MLEFNYLEYTLEIIINLDEEYDMFKYLLINTTSINVSVAQPRFENRYSSFMWVVKEEDVCCEIFRILICLLISRISRILRGSFSIG